MYFSRLYRLHRSMPWNTLFRKESFFVYTWGEILKTPGGIVSLTIVVAAKKSGVYCVRNNEEMVLFPAKEYLEWNITVCPMFCTQCIPDFFVADHYNLRNTIPPGGSKVLASVHWHVRFCYLKIYIQGSRHFNLFNALIYLWLMNKSIA
jgi:hypothetical protein